MRRQFLILLVLAALGPALGLAQDWAKARLEKSPRHLEWVALNSQGRKLSCFVAYPEVKHKATAVLVIHEIFGLTDWARGVADQLAEAGYLAIAPDLLSGLAPNGGGTAELGGDDAARKAIAALENDKITVDLNVAAEYVRKLPACNGKLAVVGFCWGGSQSFRYATNNPKLGASFVFYGTAPTDPTALARIAAPVYGFYGENDARVDATLDDTRTAMKAAGRTYQPEIYPGAGHGFMRAGEAPGAEAANSAARTAAWKRMKAVLARL